MCTRLSCWFLISNVVPISFSCTLFSWLLIFLKLILFIRQCRSLLWQWDFLSWCSGSIAGVRGPSRSMACGSSFRDHRLNSHPLHCKVDLQPLDHHGCWFCHPICVWMISYYFVCFYWRAFPFFYFLVRELVGFVVLSSLSFCLSVKLLISQLDLNENLAGCSWLSVFSFHHFKYIEPLTVFWSALLLLK